LENALNYVNKLFTVVLGFGIIWGGWFFAKSAKLKKADEGQAEAVTFKEWVQAIQMANSPLIEDMKHFRADYKSLNEKYIELSIQVGILTRENERKDSIIEAQKNEIQILKKRIKELEHEV
jgi:chromosome segregation ATPase